MKFWISTLCLGLFILTGCTKSDDLTPQEEEAISCHYTAEATVQRMVLNENGTEFFYYLEFDPSFPELQIVFPKNLPVTYWQEGMKVEVAFAKTDQLYDYIVCLAGHQINPNNPDIQYMPHFQNV